MTNNKHLILPSEILLQLKGKIKFSQIIEINKNQFRGWSRDSDLSMLISFLKFYEVGYGSLTLVSVGISPNDFFSSTYN